MRSTYKMLLAQSEAGRLRHAADAYLMKKWYGGDSRRENSNAIKSTGARFDGDSKCWVASTPQAMLELAETQLWIPACFSKADDQELALKQLRAAMAHRNLLPKASKVVAVAATPQPTAEEIERADRQMLQIQDDSFDELQLLQKYNLTAEVARAASGDGALGPRAGISDAARLLRAIKYSEWTGITVQEAHKRGTVKWAYAVEENKPRRIPSTASVSEANTSPFQASKKRRAVYRNMETPLSDARRRTREWPVTVYQCCRCGTQLDAREQFLECCTTWWRCECGRMRANCERAKAQNDDDTCTC